MEQIVDVCIFMGQSNMAGRGISSDKWPQIAPEVEERCGYEYRAVTAPDRLFTVQEPFGKDENCIGGIDDEQKKTGSLVSAFYNSYFAKNGKIPLIGISASKGGSSIAQWQENSQEGYLKDACKRYQSCMTYLKRKGINVRHQFVLWCQGETDGDIHTEKNTYFSMLDHVKNRMLQEGAEQFFMIQIGQCNIVGSEDLYKDMIQWQKEYADLRTDVSMVSEQFQTMRERGLMKDEYHYFQHAYNEVGKEAGEKTAEFWK